MTPENDSPHAVPPVPTKEEAAAADAAAKAQAEADAKAQAEAEYNSHPRIVLANMRADLSRQYMDTRDHLGILTRALHTLVGYALEAAPEAPPNPNAPKTEEADGKK